MASSALSNRNYRIFLTGATISLHGIWVYRVALGWFAWQLTHSEFWVGIVAFTQFAPTVVFSPIFGVLADRFDRRAATMIVNALSFANMQLLGWLAFRGSADINVLVALSLMQGTLDGAYAPVRLAVVPNLVRDDQRHSAIALTSVAFNLSRFIGPALAGPIIAFWGVGAAFTVNAVSYLAMVAAMAMISLSPSADRVRQHPWLELKEGARYVLAHPTIRSLLLLSLLRSALARGALEMLPAFADDVYGRGAAALSMLTSATGAGAVAVGIAMSFGTGWLTMNIIRADILVAGLFIVLLSLIGTLGVALPVVAVLGALLSLGGVGSQILIQTLVDDKVRGRVSSFWGVVVFGGTAIGAPVIGAAAHVFGLQLAVGAAGVLCALFIVGGMIRYNSATQE
jgi:MFS family permease